MRGRRARRRLRSLSHATTVPLKVRQARIINCWSDQMHAFTVRVTKRLLPPNVKMTDPTGAKLLKSTGRGHRLHRDRLLGDLGSCRRAACFRGWTRPGIWRRRSDGAADLPAGVRPLDDAAQERADSQVDAAIGDAANCPPRLTVLRPL